MPRIPHVKAAPTCRAAHMCSASAILEGQQGRLCSLEWWLKICNPWVRRSNCCCQRHNIPKYLTFELYSQPTEFSILILSMYIYIYIYTYNMYIIYIMCIYYFYLLSCSKGLRNGRIWSRSGDFLCLPLQSKKHERLNESRSTERR